MSAMKASKEQIYNLYSKLKIQYDNLLEKNQNDLIKIKIKQKTLNEKIEAIKKQREDEVNLLNQKIKSLQKQLRQKAETKPTFNKDEQTYQKEIKEKNAKIEELEFNIRSIQHQNQKLNVIICQKVLKKIRNPTVKQNEKNKLKLVQLEEEIIKFLNRIQQIKQQNNQFRLKLQEYEQGVQKYTNQISQLTEEHILVKGQLQRANEELTKYQLIISMKQKEIQILQQQQKSKPLDNNQSRCLNCQQLSQQIQLQKQIVKSVRTMLKFKEMELQQIKK